MLTCWWMDLASKRHKTISTDNRDMSRIAVEDSLMSPTPADLLNSPVAPTAMDTLFCEPCKNCGGPILRRRPNALYCSLQCRTVAQIERQRNRNTNSRRKFFCLQCERRFQATRSDASFCSPRCRQEFHRSEKQYWGR